MDQVEKAYQRQPTIFGGVKAAAIKAKGGALPRYTRNVGLGFKTPETAVKVR